MIFTGVFLSNLFKAGEPEQPEQQGSAPLMPAGQRAPEEGHKYISREWAGDHYNYTYSSTPKSNHGALGLQDFTDPSRGHSVDIPEGVDTANTPPEAAYKQSLNAGIDEAFKNGTKIELPHPGIEGESISVECVTKGKKRTFNVVHNGEIQKSLASKGALERWYLGVQQTKGFNDPEGNPFLTITPNIGAVTDGDLIPSTDTNVGLRKWIIKYHDDYPEEKRRERTGKWYASTEEIAVKQAQKMIQDLRIVQGIPEPTAPVGLESDEQQALSDAQGAAHQVVPGSVAEQIESGKFKYRINPQSGKRELDVTPLEKKEIISHAAKDYWNAAVALANKFTNSKFFLNNKKEWMERFVGDDIVTKNGNIQVPVVPALDSSSPTYQALSVALDKYDPQYGVGFSGFLLGKKGEQGGLLFRKFWEVNSLFENEVMAHGEMPGNVGAKAEQAPKYEETAGREHLQSEPVMEVADTDTWERAADLALGRWEDEAPDRSPDDRTLARRTLQRIKSSRSSSKPGLIQAFNEAMLGGGHGDYIVELRTDKAIYIAAKELTKKAMDILTKDKNVDPSHEYAFKEGSAENPRFYYKDPQGNFVKYTNAPSGSEDRSSYHGEAQIDTRNPYPEFAQNPEYFSPDGKRLNRAPDVDQSQMEWNENYSRFDPNNMWIGRWRDSVSGQNQYVYAHSDIRQIPKMQVHLQNTLLDAKLPAFRQYVVSLFESGKIKDEITAVALALLDQGKLRALDICNLTASQISAEGNLVTLGTHRVYIADARLQNALEILVKTRIPDGPIFSIPIQKKDESLEELTVRYMGPHYLSAVVESQGLSLLAFQTYHATVTFSREVTKLLLSGVSWEQAKQQALLAVALEWGHDFAANPDAAQAIQVVETTLVDPVVIEVLNTNAKNAGLDGGTEATVPQACVPVPSVTLSLLDRTQEEQEFSNWLHTHPIHEHVQVNEDGSYV